MEYQVAEVDIEIHLRWYGQPTTWEGVEQAVRQSGQPRAHTKGDRTMPGGMAHWLAQVERWRMLDLSSYLLRTDSKRHRQERVRAKGCSLCIN